MNRIQYIASECDRYHRLSTREFNGVSASDVLSSLLAYISEYMPSGAGIDCGTRIDLDASDGVKRVVLKFSYHHMNDAGMYDGWTEHKATIRPAFSGFDIRISGPDRNQVKDYMYEVFYSVLHEPHEGHTIQNVTVSAPADTIVSSFKG